MFRKKLFNYAHAHKKTKLYGVQEMEKEIEKILQRLENLKDNVADNEMPVEDYLSNKKRYDESINKLQGGN